eukprot:SAG11_NODE_8511_length_1007_cov_2.614537_1_plen_84_part_00
MVNYNKNTYIFIYFLGNRSWNALVVFSSVFSRENVSRLCFLNMCWPVDHAWLGALQVGGVADHRCSKNVISGPGRLDHGMQES